MFNKKKETCIFWVLLVIDDFLMQYEIKDIDILLLLKFKKDIHTDKDLVRTWHWESNGLSTTVWKCSHWPIPH